MSKKDLELEDLIYSKIIEHRKYMKGAFRDLLVSKIKSSQKGDLCRDCRMWNLAIFELLEEFPWDM